MVRNVGRSGTFIAYMINGPKRLPEYQLLISLVHHVGCRHEIIWSRNIQYDIKHFVLSRESNPWIEVESNRLINSKDEKLIDHKENQNYIKNKNIKVHFLNIIEKQHFLTIFLILKICSVLSKNVIVSQYNNMKYISI